MKKIIFSVFTLFVFISYAQKTSKGIPDDLNTSKIIFIEFTPLIGARADSVINADDIKKKRRKMFLGMYKARNEMIPKSTKMLRDEVKNYPFEYVICKRAEIEKYKAAGCKYLFDCRLYRGIDEGEDSVADPEDGCKMEIIDLQTGDIYHPFSITGGRSFLYDMVMKQLIRKVNKKFKEGKDD